MTWVDTVTSVTTDCYLDKTHYVYLSIHEWCVAPITMGLSCMRRHSALLSRHVSAISWWTKGDYH